MKHLDYTNDEFEKKLLKKIEEGLRRGKSFRQISRETKLHHENVAEIAKIRYGYNRDKDYRARRNRLVAILVLDGRKSKYIAKELGMKLTTVDYVRRNIIWDDYKDLMPDDTFYD